MCTLTRIMIAWMANAIASAPAASLRRTLTPIGRDGSDCRMARPQAVIAAMVDVTFIDLDHRIIPDVITLPGIPICFVASLALPDTPYKDALLGILIGGGSLFLVAWIYSILTKKEGMGGGDIKLLAMMGAIVGWQGVLFTVFVASLVGTMAGFAAMLQSRKGMKLAVPFGPFLSIGGITYIFFGTELVNWYFNLLR